ncbi:SDR family NAD(P)-dependent oxidoreductase [Labedella phragmitis]|uniref:SDR family NAD(P)-dependent oxidoreductase n=1 Tax=Labedella phragmitis TaxID=2498849 RepID=A0A3S4AJE5_9MICO|nr:SDR family oxidoreductase [Labedella phragmitis]RWZ49870.1 SDR family NAD(P)-dependent oxidoreductase [Labedella phragmitis]
MDISTSVALVTGANRGIGREFARILVERGATVYATARRPESIDLEGVRALRLDITDPESVRAAAEAASDVTLLVNNAGITTGADLVSGDLGKIRLELDTHFWGTLSMIRAFAPVLTANGGGAIANVLSALSWFSAPGAGAYHVAKAAEWALTTSVRAELAGRGVSVTGVHLGAADTDMMRGYDGPKITPAQVVEAALAGVEAGSAEVLVDDWSRFVKAGVSETPEAFYESIRTGLAG